MIRVATHTSPLSTLNLPYSRAWPQSQFSPFASSRRTAPARVPSLPTPCQKSSHISYLSFHVLDIDGRSFVTKQAPSASHAAISLNPSSAPLRKREVPCPDLTCLTTYSSLCALSAIEAFVGEVTLLLEGRMRNIVSRLIPLGRRLVSHNMSPIYSSVYLPPHAKGRNVPCLQAPRSLHCIVCTEYVQYLQCCDPTVRYPMLNHYFRRHRAAARPAKSAHRGIKVGPSINPNQLQSSHPQIIHPLFAQG